MSIEVNIRKREPLAVRVGFDRGDAKPEQVKDVHITENGTTLVEPDENFVLSKVVAHVEVPDKKEETLAEFAALIDSSGVLSSTEGTTTEKVEQLIDKAAEENLWLTITESKTTAENFFNGIVAKKLPRTNFINAVNFTQFCVSAKIDEIDYYINSCKGTGFVNAFYACTAKKMKGINVENATGVTGMFRAASIVTIEEPLNFSSVTSFGTPFWQWSAIKDIDFVEESIHCSIPFSHSLNLTPKSVQNIAKGLAYVDTPQTLTMHAKTVIPDDVKAIINAKGWTLTQ